MSQSRLHELLSAMLDRVPLSEPELAELDALFAEPAQQQKAVAFLEMEAALRARVPLGDIAGPVMDKLSAARASESLADDVLEEIAHRPVMRWSGGGERNSRSFFSSAKAWLPYAACAAALVFAGIVFFRKEPIAAPVEQHSIVTVTTLSGSAVFSSGDTSRSVLAGETLPSGLFRVEGEDSSLQLLFADGTQLAASGQTQFMVRQIGPLPGQKQVQVLTGNLSADVRPQPARLPLTVVTPTARLEVLGTIFRIAADEQGTQLDVDQGKVRLLRLADGEAIEVTARHTAVATLDDSRRLQATASNTLLDNVTIRFQNQPAHGRGQWQPADGSVPPRVAAVPCVVGRKPDGSPRVHHGLVVKSSAPLAAVHRSSRLRLRWRTAEPSALRVMLGTNTGTGGFGGNFESAIAITDATPDSHGWRTATLPIAAFRPSNAAHPQPPDAGRLAFVMLTTYENDAQLELTELQITDQ